MPGTTADSLSPPSGKLVSGTVALCAAVILYAVAVEAPAQTAPANSTADDPKPAAPAAAAAGGNTQASSTADPMRIEKELISAQEVANFLKSVPAYRNALKSNTPTEAEQKLIADGVRISVYKMTLKAERDNLYSFRSDLLRDVKIFAKGSENARKILLQNITNRSAELLDGNFAVRLNAVILLTQLNLREAPIGKDESAAPFVPAHKPLLQVVADPSQPLGVKIPAVAGLVRIMRDGPPDEVPRREIAIVMADELEKSDPADHPWYQVRLCDALAAARTTFSDAIQQNPRFVDVLVKLVGDPRRQWLARSEAARAVGRLPLEGNVNSELVLFAIVKLTKEMADAYNKDPRQYRWKNCFTNVYLSFRALDARDKVTRNSIVDRLNSKQRVVDDAYQQVLPIVRHVIISWPAPLDDGLVKSASQWMESNQPANLRIAPNLDPITQQAPDKQAAVTKSVLPDAVEAATP